MNRAGFETQIPRLEVVKVYTERKEDESNNSAESRWDLGFAEEPESGKRDRAFAGSII